MGKLLTLDLSTTCTGYAIFDTDSHKLLKFDKIKPTTPKGKTYPEKQLETMRNMAHRILEICYDIEDLECISIEEVNKGISRLGQKVLCGVHFLLLDKMSSEQLKKVYYIDSDGAAGWRTLLNLKLTESDKKLNRQRRAFNKKLPKYSKDKLPIITKKHMACRFVNKNFNLKLDVDKNSTDNDVCDAIGIGAAILQFHLTKF